MKKRKVFKGLVLAGMIGAVAVPSTVMLSSCMSSTFNRAKFKDFSQSNINLNFGEQNITDPNGLNATETYTWKTNLYDYLVSTNTIIPKTEGGKVDINTVSASDINYSALGTQIGIWASQNQEQGFALTQWIDNQIPFIPFIQSGLDYRGYKIAKKGLHPITSLNGSQTYRDWFTENGANDSIKYTAAANPMANQNVPLGIGFVDAPTSTYFQSAQLAWVTWQTDGEYKFDDNGELIASPKANLMLEAASKIKFIDKDGKEVEVFEEGAVSKQDNKTKTVDKGVINQELAQKAMQTTEKVEFTINKSLKWYDKNGKEMSTVSSKDFLYGLIGYYNSSSLKFNTNGYFFDLAGIDFAKTLEANGAKWDSNSLSYSVNSEDTFTYSIGSTKNGSFLDILTKEYFFAVPSNYDSITKTTKIGEIIKPLSEYTDVNNNKNKVQIAKTVSGSKTTYAVDKQKTIFSNIYGGGLQDGTGLDVWSAGPYRVASVNRNAGEVIFRKNQGYFDTLTNFNNSSIPNGQQVNEINLIIGVSNGNPPSQEVAYDNMKSGSAQYAIVPDSRKMNALQSFNTNGDGGYTLIIEPGSRAPQSQTINYATNIWDENGNRKSNITPVYENFVKKFNTSGLKIRQGISNLINWSRLSQVGYSDGSRDYIQSSVPYGYLDRTNDDGSIESQYQIIRDSNKTYGGMPITGIIAQNYNAMYNTATYDMNNAFTEQIEKDFFAALDDIGATKENPLALDFRTLHSTYSQTQTAYMNRLKKTIEGISGGRITFNLIARTNQSLSDWYYNKNSPMGSFFWSPDYNGIGTWVGLYFEVEEGATGPIDSELYSGYQGAYGVATLWKPLFDTIVAAKKATTTN